MEAGDLSFCGKDKSVWSSCNVLTLQLVVRDGLKEQAICSRTQKASAKCQRIAKLSKQSTLLKLELETAIHQSNLTKWNSEFKMMKTILSNSASIISSLVSCGLGSLELSTREKQTLGEILPVLDFSTKQRTCCKEIGMQLPPKLFQQFKSLE